MRGRLQRLTLPALQLGMRACWLWAWVSLVEVKTIGPGAIAPVVVLFLFLAALMRAALDALPLKVVARVALHWLSWVLLAALAGKLLLFPSMPWGQGDWLVALPRALLRLIFETRPAELLLLVGSGCAWYLGGRAASQRPSHESFLGQFQFGLVLLLAAYLIAHGMDVSIDHPVLLSLAYFVLSLSGIAVTRSRRGNEQGTLPADRQFTSSLASMLLIVTVLGLLAGIAITPDLIGVLIDAVRAVFHALETALIFLFSLLPAPDMPEGAELEPPATGDDQSLLDFYRTLPVSALFRRVMFIIWTVLVLGMFLFALWRLCSMVLEWLKRRSNMAGVEVESLEGGLLADLLGLLLWVDRQGRRLAAFVSRYVGRWLTPGGQPTCGAIYAGFLRWAGRKVQLRIPSQSAHEYQAALSELIPAATTDLAFVTRTYTRARYGRWEPDDSALQEMQSAVQRIRKAPRRRNAGGTNTLVEGAE